MDGGGVDHDAQDTRAEGQARHGDESSSDASALTPRLVPAAAVVSPRWARKRSATDTGLGRRFEHHPREVEGLRRGRRPGRRPDLRAATATWRRRRGLRGRRRSAAGGSSPCSSTRMSRPPGAVGRTLVPTPTPAGECSVGRVPSGLTGDAVEGGTRELGPHGVVGVLVTEPAGLPEDGRREPSPSRPGSRRAVEGQREAAWGGSSSTGSRRPPSTASFDVMGRTLGAALCPSQPLWFLVPGQGHRHTHPRGSTRSGAATPTLRTAPSRRRRWCRDRPV